VAVAASLLLLGFEMADAQQPDVATVILPSGKEFKVEIAADPEKHRLGYMFREYVGPDEGMLFLFDRTERRDFWMKNCKVSLDIIWLDEGLKVVQIAHEAPPCPESGPCPSIVPLRPARYVLELAGGMANRHELAIGNRLVVVSDPPIR
jgi:uncharacterized membrane protein (UPF0127 family)